MAAGTGWFRGENGLVLEMDLPLNEAFTTRLQRQEVVRVNEDGTPWEPEETPAAAAPDEPADGDELRAELEAALTENAGLSDELALITKQRGDLAAEVGQLKEQLADVTKQRDEAIQDEEAAAAKPPASKAKTAAK